MGLRSLDVVDSLEFPAKVTTVLALVLVYEALTCHVILLHYVILAVAEGDFCLSNFPYCMAHYNLKE